MDINNFSIKFALKLFDKDILTSSDLYDCMKK